MKKQRSGFLRILVMITVSLYTIVLFNGAIITKYRVTIKDANTKTYVYTSVEYPNIILEEQGVMLSDNDTFTFSGYNDKNEGTITINRAMPVNVYVDGKVYTKEITTGNVDYVLTMLGIKVNEDDLINVSLNEQITSDMDIIINRVTYKEVKTVEEIPYQIEEIITPTLKNNKRRTLSQGHNGELETTTLQKFIDGKLISEETISSNVVKEPISARILLGDTDSIVSKLTPAYEIPLDNNGNPINYKSVVRGKATAYSALGKRTSLKPGCVAMDLSQFPRGTRLYIKTPDGDFIYGYSEVR
ncbi:MAG: G5 domain-containing protein, partial [Oscillospiraceae bacterium]